MGAGSKWVYDLDKGYYVMNHERKPKVVTMEVGKSGDYPNGKLTDKDEGGLVYKVGRYKDTVIMEFGTPVKWLGLPPENARELAQVLIKHADAIEGGD